MDRKILVTGDFWHRDFQRILAGFDSVTLIPVKKIMNTVDENVDLLVIAQSRPDQYSQETITQLQQQFPNCPFVVVAGSWCEGELRTGKPWPGVLRVYWHQWQGRFASFSAQLTAAGIADWHAPQTASTADRIQLQANELRQSQPDPKIQCVGISAWTQSQFEMIRDAIEKLGWQTRWVERGTWDAQSNQFYNPICIEADSLTPEVERRIDWLRCEFPHSGFVMILNFPRVNDLQQLSAKGITQVVSKPFELNDLKSAIEQAFQQSLPDQYRAAA